MLHDGKAGLTCCIAGRLCPQASNGGGKRLSREGDRVTTEVVVEGKRKKFPQSIQCIEPDCGVLCCAESPKCIAQLKLHFEKHLLTNTVESSIEECHSSALYWRYFFSRDFDNAAGARGALVELSQRRQLMELHLSHSDVKSCGICKTALGPVVFSTQKSFLCLSCFVRVAGISAEHAFRDDKCFLRW